LSLHLLLDEDSQAKYLVNLLHTVGHDVITVNEAGLGGRLDATVLDYARQQMRVLLTRNCDDFEELHQAKPTHPGILAVYQNSDSLKNMSYQSIVGAISNLEAVGYAIENQFIVLNQWNY
jgi:predicted nuclease of predicted toxin-antitoxin system